MEFAQTAARLESLANSLSEWLDRHKVGSLTGISVVCLIITIAWARSEQFWFDELFTYYIALQPSLHGLWAALTAPIDYQPPMFFLLTRAASHLVSDPHIGLRLPGMFGFCLLSVCVFLYTARRTTALWGIVAMVVLYLTPAYHYAHEARPYGLAAGFAALALLSWQNAARGTWRSLSLAGLAVGIAAAISSSYYAVLVVAPLALAEITRSLWRRSVDRAVWAALTCGAGVAFLYLPLVTRYVGSFPGQNWASPHKSIAIDMYGDLLRDTPLAGVLVLLAAAAGLIWPRPEPERRDIAPGDPAPWEVVAAAGFALIPFLGYLVAVWVTKMITFRYVLPAVIGFSILVTWTLYRRTRSSALSGVVLVCLLAGAAAAGQIRAYRYDVRSRQSATASLRQLLSGQPGWLPVVVDDPLRCLELCHYEKPDVASRLFYLVDPEASLHFGSVPYQETTDWLMMNRFMPVRAETMEAFRQRTKQFLLYATGSPLGFVLAKLAAGGARIRLLAVRGGESLFLVDDVP
jgi:hypothetical protein